MPQEDIEILTYSTDNFECNSNGMLEGVWDDAQEGLLLYNWPPASLDQISTTIETQASTFSTNTKVASSLLGSKTSRPRSKRQQKAVYCGKASGRMQRRQENMKDVINPGQPKFSCPFRKHDPSRYGIQCGWSICTLSWWDSIARLKFVSLPTYVLYYAVEKF
jgi:hypothetical protein